MRLMEEATAVYEMYSIVVTETIYYSGGSEKIKDNLSFTSGVLMSAKQPLGVLQQLDTTFEELQQEDEEDDI